MASMTLSDFAEGVCEIMPVITREFFKRQSDEFCKAKLTIPQFVVLDALYRHGESNMTDISRYMNVTTASITGLVDRLVRDGYVKREQNPEDRRVVKIHLTPKGDKIIRGAVADRKRKVAEIFGMISAEERANYLRILMHVRDHIKDIKH